ncbi:MAG: tyrosine-type recombinase/integrase, partial [Candidatus Geothermarchaeales archaeon]
EWGADMMPPRYARGPPVKFYHPRKPESLIELALAHGFFREGAVVESPQRARARPKDHWKNDPPLVREYVFLARAEGLASTSVENGRQIVRRYARFLGERLGTTLEEAGWREYVEYKLWLAQSRVARTTARVYLFYIQIFYRLRAQSYQDPQLLEAYMRIRAAGAGRPGKSKGWKPLDPLLVRRLLEAAEGEDYVFLMTLLHTGGRAQFYGLRVDNVDLVRGEITVEVKSGREATIPIHPNLAPVLEEHLASRGYDSPYLFRNGKDISTLRGQRANRQNAWRICKRVQRQAAVVESVHPHRFRKTLATYVRKTATDPQILQAILTHARLDRTLDDYTYVELDEVKRRFAHLDPLRSNDGDSSETMHLLERLRDLGPEGKEFAWAQLVDGLMGLVGDES